MRTVWLHFAFFLLILCQLAAGDWGFYLPFLVFGAFYFGVTGPWGAALFGTLLWGGILGLLRNCAFPYEAVVGSGALLAGIWWRRNREVRQLRYAWEAGLWLALAAALPPVLLELARTGGRNWFTALVILLPALLAGLMLPLWLLLLEIGSELLGLPGYRDADRRREAE